MAAECLSTEVEDGILLDRKPARLVPPVLEERFTRLQELFPERRVKAFETREQHDHVASRPGDRDGVELEVAEAPDHPVRGGPGAFPGA